METRDLQTLLRAADRTDRPAPVDQLVEEGVRRGRRRLRERRLTALGAVGATLAAAGAVVAFALPGSGSGGGVTVAPAGTPSPSRSVEQTKEGRLPTTAELQKLIKANLPEGLTLRKAVGEDGMISYELGDEDGYSWSGGGVLRTDWFGHVPCTEAQGCTVTEVEGGRLQISRDPEKVGDGTWYTFVRDDGRAVWFGQRNAFDGNGPVTREKLPLTDKQAIALVTSDDWTPWLDRLPKESPHGEPGTEKAELQKKAEQKKAEQKKAEQRKAQLEKGTAR
ncbi:hypothetical protein [Microlunatus parietis]|uniref:Uncharacterized protein n=1 Tax=Microlunatus parietis TaxID=682979 RepID=A0A7Y9I549_9ACTN|nr:hypothetical protein [Microlunatus parietis]NYE70283.1 hypothetical protein [Microlunatus parietis]